MNQQYHVVFKKGTVTVRRPWKGKDVELYSSSGNEKAGIPAMFGSHEKRQFLEALGAFIVVSIDNKGVETGIARQILDEGYVVEDPDTKEHSTWHVAGYYVRDDGAVYIMTPQVTKDSEFFGTLGLRIDLENSWGNSFKVGKYLKRLFSHHRKYIQGEVIKEVGNIILVRLNNGKVLSVKYADHGKLTDGMNLVSTHCMKMLGLKKNVGMGLRLTALSPKGFSKGHAIVLPNLQHDLVLFNSKKLLFGDKFTFAIDWLHSGAVFTDTQSVVNFRMKPFLPDWAEVFMNTVIDAIGDSEKLKRMLRFYHVDFHKHGTGDEAGEFIEKEKDWALLRTLRGGIDHKPYPGLIRKIFHLFADKVQDCENNMRIPVAESLGGARYALVDPTIFDDQGEPTLAGELKGNTVYIPEHQGEIVFHRQPNAHRSEHHIAKSVQSEMLKSIDTGCFLFMSRDMVIESLMKLGGGDQDDRLVYYKDQAVVDHFKTLEADPYPVEHIIEKTKPVERVNVFANRLRKPVYDRSQLLVMLDQQKKQGVSIGYAVNAIMQDTAITDSKAEIINYITEALPKDAKTTEALAWMNTREDYELRGVASRLEVIIDAVKKEGSDLRDIGNSIKKFNQSYMVVPQFFINGGKFGGRVPTSRRGDTHPVIVRTSLDETMDQIKAMRNDLENIVTDLSWQMLQPIPLEILTQPLLDEKGADQLAVAIQTEYRSQWTRIGATIDRTNDKEEVKKTIDAYIKIDESLANMFQHHPYLLDAMVRLYIRIYENRAPQAPRDDDGKPVKFPDGILWGPRMSRYTMKMLEMVGLAGRYTEVMFYPDAKQYAKAEETTVTIKDGVVTTEGSNVQIGMVDPMADGGTKLDKGLAFVKAKDAYAYEPQQRWMLLSVLNGMHAKGATPVEISNWRKQGEHKQVTLVPYIYDNNGVDEHAVRVMLDGTEYGHISREDNAHITTITQGWLVPGKTPKSMSVVVEEC